MEDLDEASFVLMLVHRDRSHGIVAFQQKAYVNHILKRFTMKNCSYDEAHISKSDWLNKDQAPKNDLDLSFWRISHMLL